MVFVPVEPEQYNVPGEGALHMVHLPTLRI